MTAELYTLQRVIDWQGLPFGRDELLEALHSNYTEERAGTALHNLVQWRLIERVSEGASAYLPTALGCEAADKVTNLTGSDMDRECDRCETPLIVHGDTYKGLLCDLSLAMNGLGLALVPRVFRDWLLRRVTA